MMPHSVSEIWRNHHQAGPLNQLISISAFVDDSTFLTKGGELGVIFRIRGVDYECLEPHGIDTVARRFEACLRSLGEEYRLYQYLLKRAAPTIPSDPYTDDPVVNRAIQGRAQFLKKKAADLYSIDIYFVLLFDGWRQSRTQSLWSALFTPPHKTWKPLLSGRSQITLLDTDLVHGIQTLAAKAASILVQLKELIGAEQLSKNDAYQFLLCILNYDIHRIENSKLQDLTTVDEQLAQSSIECHRDHLRVQQHYVKALSVLEPPAETFAHMLRHLWEVSSNVIVVCEWKRESGSQIRKLIRGKRRHFHNSKTSLANYLNSTPTSDRSLLIDDSDEALVSDLGLCLRELEVAGNYFGAWSMTLILYDLSKEKLDRAVAECVKVFATQGAALLEERYNLLNAWMAAIPGNHAYNLRRLYLLNTNCADLSLLYNLDGGEVRNHHLNQEYLAVLETNQHTPYYLNLHYQDNAHTAIFGATGSGKSFLLNFLITNLQKYGSRTIIFDLGGGYENITQLFGGCYSRVGVEPSFSINPFVLESTRENLHFLYSFVRVLIESGGHELSSVDERDLQEQIRNLYQIEADNRRLLTLRNIVNRRLGEQLDKWVGDGPYATLFDNIEDNLTFAKFQCFDFEGMDQYPQILEPLLFYILHRANAFIHAPELNTQFKVFVMDEAWRFFRNRTIDNYLVEALKTWRKKNAAVILATQSADDLTASQSVPIIVESCAVKIFLANPGMDRANYRKLFHLNEAEVELVARLAPKQQMLIKRPDLSKILNLHVNSTEYWLYTSNPHENARRRKVFENYGFEGGLEVLTKEMSA